MRLRATIVATLSAVALVLSAGQPVAARNVINEHHSVKVHGVTNTGAHLVVGDDGSASVDTHSSTAPVGLVAASATVVNEDGSLSGEAEIDDDFVGLRCTFWDNGTSGNCSLG